MDRSAALNVLEEIAAKLERDFPIFFEKLKFGATFMNEISNKALGFDIHEDGSMTFARDVVNFSATEIKERLPQYREQIIQDKCSRYSLFDKTKYGVKRDFFYFVRQQYETIAFCTIGVCLTMHPEIFKKSFEGEWIALCEQLAKHFSAIGGFCEFTNYSNDNSFASTPMRNLSGKEVFYDHLYDQKHCGTVVSGYHWCVLLTEDHIRLLGGKERVLEDAPCYGKHLWTIAGKEAIFLQATESIFDFTPEERLKLKLFLDPVLSPVDPLIAAVEETVYEGMRMDNVVFSAEEREAIDELKKRHTPKELNQLLIEKYKNSELQKKKNRFNPYLQHHRRTRYHLLFVIVRDVRKESMKERTHMRPISITLQ